MHSNKRMLTNVLIVYWFNVCSLFYEIKLFLAFFRKIQRNWLSIDIDTKKKRNVSGGNILPPKARLKACGL